jgi:hypothetical protein
VVSVKMSAAEVEELDRRRGALSRSAYLRQRAVGPVVVVPPAPDPYEYGPSGGGLV